MLQPTLALLLCWLAATAADYHEALRIVGVLRPRPGASPEQLLFAFLKSAERAAVSVGGDGVARRTALAGSVVFVEDGALGALGGVAARFAWCRLAPSAASLADAVAGAVGGAPGPVVAAAVGGVTFQGALTEGLGPRGVVYGGADVAGRHELEARTPSRAGPGRRAVADSDAASSADLFERHRTSGACDARKRDVIFSVYNYPDASTLYLFLRSLREAGGVADAVVFTHRAHRALRAVGDRYGARVLEYFAPLTGHPTVAAIMARPHMQALKVDFPGPLIKNYKFTFMYCYLLEFGELYGRAAFMDVRDLYFQRDPFAYAACLGLTAATETAALDVDDRKSIHADHDPRHCDTRWEDFRHLPPINSGAFIADVAAMLRIVNASAAVVDRCGAGYDQGTFTELVYLGRLPGTPVALSTTETGAIGMICNSLDVAYDTYREVANDAGDAYAIVHQFDRFAELTDDLSTRMPLDHAELLAPKATMLEPQTCGGEG
ncbi:hypothetical protein JL720_9241 [Aureococcus anophagefferens]|nr:hypothetical protein JL720_9241 [Aureococcus anophagefferens]